MKKSCYYCVHKTESVTSEVCLKCCRKTDEYGNTGRPHRESFDAFSPTNLFLSHQLDNLHILLEKHDEETVSKAKDRIMERVTAEANELRELIEALTKKRGK